MNKASQKPVSPPACQPCGPTPGVQENPNLHWIEIEMIYENKGEPVSNEEYLVRLPDGSERRGHLDEMGIAREANIPDPGQCDISFPKLDKEAWEPA